MLDEILNLWASIEKNTTHGISLPLWKGYSFFEDCEEIRELRSLLKEYLLYAADVNSADVMMKVKRPHQYSLKLKGGLSIHYRVQAQLPEFKYYCAIIKDSTKYGIILE